MSQDYNLGSTFGFNVSSKGTAFQGAKELVSELNNSAGNLFESMTDYVAKYEDVFNGNVANEINMYSRQAMIVGMNLKAADGKIRNFDMNI